MTFFDLCNALAVLSPLASAIFINLIPLATMVAGVLFLGERLTWMTLLGGALNIGSIFMVNLRAPSPHQD